MHEKMKTKLTDVIRELVSKTIINNGNINFDHDFTSLNALTLELNKRKDSVQLEIIESFWIYMDALDYVVFQILGWAKENVYVFSNFNTELLITISNHVLDYYLDIPNSYEVKISLPNITLPDTPTTENLYLTSETRAKERTLLDALTYTPSKVVIRTDGYFFSFKEDIFLKDVLSKLNVVIFLLTETYVFKHKPVKSIQQNWSLSLTSHQIPSVNVEIINQKLHHKLFHTTLHFSISKYYSEISINDKADLNLIPRVIALANQIISDASAEAMRIKSAIDWFVLSNITNDTMMSFLQICIGLESIYGDDNSEGGLTNTLADRCSYLISNDIKQRKYVKKRFMEIYRIRSKIVHGVNIKHTSDIISLKSDALNYLKESINKEISNMKWHL